MRSRIAVLLGVLFVLTAADPGEASVPAAHDKPWWRAVIANDFAPPPGTSMDGLLLELNGYLASPDPELRDDIAYGVLTNWLYVSRLLPPERRDELIGAWRDNLRRKIGERGTDSVFLRSFSALMLSVAAALDNQEPYLDAGQFDRLLASALRYLQEERDTRSSRGRIATLPHLKPSWMRCGRRRRTVCRLRPNSPGTRIAGIYSCRCTRSSVRTNGTSNRCPKLAIAYSRR